MPKHSPENNEVFDFDEVRSKTLPSTSGTVDIQDPTIPPSELLKIPEDPSSDYPTSPSTAANNSKLTLKDENTQFMADDTLKIEDRHPSRGTEDTIDEMKKLNNGDKLDGTWIPSIEDDEKDKKDDDLCLDCLYVSMQCCECSIL